MHLNNSRSKTRNIGHRRYWSKNSSSPKRCIQKHCYMNYPNRKYGMTPRSSCCMSHNNLMTSKRSYRQQHSSGCMSWCKPCNSVPKYQYRLKNNLTGSCHHIRDHSYRCMKRNNYRYIHCYNRCYSCRHSCYYRSKNSYFHT